MKRIVIDMYDEANGHLNGMIEINSEELDSKEAFWIDYFNSKVDGYNATVGNALKK